MWNLIIHSVIHSMDTEFNSTWVPVWIRMSSRIGPITAWNIYWITWFIPTKWLISSASKKMFVCCWSYAWLSYRVCCYATVSHSSMHKPDCSLTPQTATLHSSMFGKKITCFQISYKLWYTFILTTSLSPLSEFFFFSHHGLQWSVPIMPVNTLLVFY